MENNKMDIGLDIETKGLNATAFLIGCITRSDRKKPKYFYTPNEMWNYITTLIKKEQKYGHKINIYAHHHLYDFTGYAQNHLTDLGENKILRIKKKPPIFYILNKTGYILDTMNLYGRIPLKKIGEMINLPKLEMPEELTDTKKEWTQKEINKLKPYVTRDATIVLKSVQQLKKNLQKVKNIGHRPRKCYTASGISYNFFKQYCRINKHENTPYFHYFWNLNNKGNTYGTKHFKKLSMAYRGARVECYKKGQQQNINGYDVNSMYPYCLTIMPIPDLRTEKHHTEPNEKILEKIGVVKATIQTPKYQNIMYLPIRYKKCQIYPYNTTLQGYWTTHEIKQAKKYGYKIIKLHESITYDTLPTNPFKKYLEMLYQQRQQSTGLMKNTIKLLMNSLYGRWAMQINEEQEITCYGNQILEYKKQGYEIKSDFGEKVLMVKEGEKKPSKNTHPIISLLTTAYARTKLYEDLIKIPFEDIIYTDTDSIITNNNHDNKLQIGNKLGEWKKEHKNTNGYFTKEKNYQIGKKIVTAGVPITENSTEYLKGIKSITSKQMYSHQQGLKTGQIKKIGTFYNITKNIRTTSKRDMTYPEYISECAE